MLYTYIYICLLWPGCFLDGVRSTPCAADGSKSADGQKELSVIALQMHCPALVSRKLIPSVSLQSYGNEAWQRPWFRVQKRALQLRGSGSDKFAACVLGADDHLGMSLFVARDAGEKGYRLEYCMVKLSVATSHASVHKPQP